MPTPSPRTVIPFQKRILEVLLFKLWNTLIRTLSLPFFLLFLISPSQNVKNEIIGSCTAVVATVDKRGILRVLNVGDSGFFVFRDQEIVLQSKAPLLLSLPPTCMFSFTRCSSINSTCPISLALRVQIIRHMAILMSFSCKRWSTLIFLSLMPTTNHSLITFQGDVVVLATDGVIDNLFEYEICEIVAEIPGTLLLLFPPLWTCFSPLFILTQSHEVDSNNSRGDFSFCVRCESKSWSLYTFLQGSLCTSTPLLSFFLSTWPHFISDWLIGKNGCKLVGRQRGRHYCPCCADFRLARVRFQPWNLSTSLCCISDGKIVTNNWSTGEVRRQLLPGEPLRLQLSLCEIHS